MNEIKIHRIGPRQAEVLSTTWLFGVKIPKGFRTDGASVPRLFWFVLSPFTEALYAAVVHDFQLSTNGHEWSHRAHIDRQFFHNLRASKGINIVRCLLAYFAVSLWSWYYVRRFRK